MVLENHQSLDNFWEFSHVQSGRLEKIQMFVND